MEPSCQRPLVKPSSRAILSDFLSHERWSLAGVLSKTIILGVKREAKGQAVPLTASLGEMLCSTWVPESANHDGRLWVQLPFTPPYVGDDKMAVSGSVLNSRLGESTYFYYKCNRSIAAMIRDQ